MDINIKEIKKLYVSDKWTLRRIAEKFKTNHHLIRRRLVQEGVEITSLNRIRKPFSETHKKNISESCKGRVGANKGKKFTDPTLLCRNMQAHLKYDVSLEWLLQFEDIEKLKFLNKSITRGRDSKGFTTELYQQFIEKFYHDAQFCKLYQLWVDNGKAKWLRPSLDHINPKSKNGKLNSLDNLQFLTWFENRAKVDMTANEWKQFKHETHTHSDLFIEGVI